MKSFYQQHLDRLRSALDPTAADPAGWLTEHTRLKNRPFSYKGHEYQQAIAADLSPSKCVRKPSQCGISELSSRLALAFVLQHPGTTAIYICPTALFSQIFAKTRVDVVIDESPDIRSQLYPGTDSSTVKRFLNNSFLFFKGASKSGQAISTPGDFLIVDELDFAEDPDIISQFTSRLTHSEYRHRLSLSTPTVPGFGISAEFEASRRFIEFQTCGHCNHRFHADYFEHVVLPRGRSGKSPALRGEGLKQINYLSRQLIEGYDLSKAYLECPKCGRQVDQFASGSRAFVCENQDSAALTNGYQVTPFASPATVSPGELVRLSTQYQNVADFYNFALGMPHTTSENKVTVHDAEALFAKANSSDFPSHARVSVMGLDMGGECACLTGELFPATGTTPDHLRVYHAELVPRGRLKTRYSEVSAEQRVCASVIDALPYTDTVSAIQLTDPNAWACLFTQQRGGSTQLFQVRATETDESKALFGVKQLVAQRDRGLDLVLAMIHAGSISFSHQCLPMQAVIVKHLTDMNRIRQQDRFGEDRFVWRKSERGTDHFFFALLYLVMASHMQASAGLTSVTPPFLVRGLKLKRKV